MPDWNCLIGIVDCMALGMPGGNFHDCDAVHPLNYLGDLERQSVDWLSHHPVGAYCASGYSVPDSMEAGKVLT